MAIVHLIIHIGLPKCASTSFQHALWEQRQELLKLGVFVPLAGRRKDPSSSDGLTAGHDMLAIQSAVPKRLRRALAKQVQLAMEMHCKVLLLSCENITHPDNIDQFLNFAKSVRDLKAKGLIERFSIVMFDREESNWLRSCYHESVCDGRTFEQRPFEKFLLNNKWQTVMPSKIIPLAKTEFGESLYVSKKLEEGYQNLSDCVAELCEIEFEFATQHPQRTSPSGQKIEERRLANVAFGKSWPTMLIKQPQKIGLLLSFKLPAKLRSKARSFYRKLLAHWMEF